MRKKIALIMIISLSLVLLSGCKKEAKPYVTTQFAMDTVIEITAYGDNAKIATDQALAEFKRIESLTNQFAKNSQISQINQAAGEYPVVVDKDVIEMIKTANDRAKKLDGALDITIGPLTKLWSVGKKGDFVPSDEEIAELLDLVDYKLIIIDENESTVYLPKKGMRLDLGAVAKEYGTLKICNILKQNNITSALINAGGNIRTIGTRPDGTPWRIGIQDPRNPDKIAAIITLTNWNMLETSGDYQRFFEKDGIRYSHILNPKTGKQPNEVMSVTVISNSENNNYMLATSLFVLGPEKGKELIKQFPDTEAVWITSNKDIITTDGLGNELTQK
ncbi:FAD:protein FMN transferase [Selenomonadales bacterium OttesenSCG-928-I06]|nr:FAD:protein FMN transferase [Selenomonadales bacterium OttesenSCG-928-I06]